MIGKMIKRNWTLGLWGGTLCWYPLPSAHLNLHC